MIIRCPNCEFSRSLSPDRIPPNSELATCPKCKQRFRFRTLEHLRREPVDTMPPPEAAPPGKVQKADLWDALDSFNKNLDLQEKALDHKAQSPHERAEQEKAARNDYYIPNFAEEKQSSKDSDKEANLPGQEIPVPKENIQAKTQEKTLVKTIAKALAKTKAKAKAKALAKTQGKAQTKAQTKAQAKHVQMRLEDYGNEKYEGKEEAANEEYEGKEDTNEKYANEEDTNDEYTNKEAANEEYSEQSPKKELEQNADYASENLNQAEYPQSQEENGEEDSIPGTADFEENFEQGLDKYKPSTRPDTKPDTRPDAGPDAGPDSEIDEEIYEEIYEEIPFALVPPPELSPHEKSQSWESEEKQAKGKDLRLHSYKDSPPEEKVEQDLLLLRSDEEKPVRDLGLLRDIKEDEAEDEAEDVEEGEPQDIYWENPDKYGWFSSFFRTGKEVMFSAPAFFKKSSKSSSLSFSFLFFIIHAYFSILCILLWLHIAALVLAMPQLKTLSSSLPAILMLTPVVLGLLLILAAGCTRMLIQLMLKNQKIKFYDSCRLLSYSVSPLILSIIPFIGPIAGSLWSLVSLCTGARYAYNLPWHKAFVATMPSIIIIIMAIYFMA